MCITPCILECVKTVQRSHPAHTAPGLYPSDWRSQSDIVLLWLLSMVLHISSEMTKSFNQRPWPLASLLVLLHSHSLMWHWIGIGHRPHSRDWYHLCCSHAYGSGTALRSAAVCLILCLFLFTPALKWAELHVQYPWNKNSPPFIDCLCKIKKKTKTLQSSQNVIKKCPAAVHPRPHRWKHSLYKE